MQGVTTAIVAFIFACLVWPHLVKHKPQFYAALGLVLVVILFDAIGQMSLEESGALHRVMYVLAALVQILTILLLVLCVGGLTVREFAGEVASTIDVIRHGEQKPVIVPMTGEVPKAKQEAEPTRYTIDDKPDQSIPLENP